MTTDDGIGWRAALADLDAVAGRLSAEVGEGREADLAIKMLGAVMGAYLTHVWGEPDHPAFLPSVGYHQMYGTPNPDTIYRSASVDGSGRYLLTGLRGTVPDVTIMPFGLPAASGVRTYAPLDLDDLRIADDGSFEVELAAEPGGTGRDWWRLEPDTRTLMLRSVSERWGTEDEPRVAITRLDTGGRRARVAVDAARSKLASLPLVVEGMVRSGLTRASAIRAGGANRLAEADYSAAGARPDQWYHEGWFDLGEDQVLLVEARPSPEVRSFSLALTDPYFSTIDWATAQSSLNRAQALVDADNVLRAVVGADDPGVHNWLDTTGHRAGVLQCRWTGGDAPPPISVTLLPADALPVSMERVTPEQRRDAVRARQIGVQLRSKW